MIYATIPLFKDLKVVSLSGAYKNTLDGQLSTMNTCLSLCSKQKGGMAGFKSQLYPTDVPAFIWTRRMRVYVYLTTPC